MTAVKFISTDYFSLLFFFSFKFLFRTFLFGMAGSVSPKSPWGKLSFTSGNPARKIALF
jgi:hypothetical protein